MLNQTLTAESSNASGRMLRGQFVSLVLLAWGFAGVAMWRSADGLFVAIDPNTVVTQVDPNAAPWWELSMLPHLGDSLAREITEYRTEIDRPFVRAADLEQVPGIGPKTVQRLAPHLRFPTPDDHAAALSP